MRELLLLRSSSRHGRTPRRRSGRHHQRQSDCDARRSRSTGRAQHGRARAVQRARGGRGGIASGRDFSWTGTPCSWVTKNPQEAASTRLPMLRAPCCRGSSSGLPDLASRSFVALRIAGLGSVRRAARGSSSEHWKTAISAMPVPVARESELALSRRARLEGRPARPR